MLDLQGLDKFVRPVELGRSRLEWVMEGVHNVPVVPLALGRGYRLVHYVRLASLVLEWA